MSDDPHPLIKRAAHIDGWSQNADVDPDDFIGLQKYKMVLSPPDHRMKALHDIDQAISAQDGTLRQQSELVRLRLELSKTHEELLKAGK